MPFASATKPSLMMMVFLMKMVFFMMVVVVLVMMIFILVVFVVMMVIVTAWHLKRILVMRDVRLLARSAGHGLTFTCLCILIRQ